MECPKCKCKLTIAVANVEIRPPEPVEKPLMWKYF